MAILLARLEVKWLIHYPLLVTYEYLNTGGILHFKLKKGTIVTLDQEDILDADGYTIKVVPIYKWLLG